MAEQLPASVSLLPVVHPRTPHYKTMDIPGNVLLKEDGTMEGTDVVYADFNPFLKPDQIRSFVVRELLFKMLVDPAFRSDPEFQVIAFPYLTTHIRHEKDERFIYRADLLVARDFPKSIHLLGRDLVQLAAHDAQKHMQDPETNYWLNMALLSPFDQTELDYTNNGYDSTMRVQRNDDIAEIVGNKMRRSHTGI